MMKVQNGVLLRDQIGFFHSFSLLLRFYSVTIDVLNGCYFSSFVIFVLSKKRILFINAEDVYKNEIINNNKISLLIELDFVSFLSLSKYIYLRYQYDR